VRSHLADRQATLLDHEPRPPGFRIEQRLDDGLVLLPGIHRQQQPVRGLAYIDATRAFPPAREPGVELTPDRQVAFYVRDPTRLFRQLHEAEHAAG
jgi:hypothetical protein